MKNERDVVGESLHDLCRLVDSPVSLGVWKRYCSAHLELAEATIDPLAYNDRLSFKLDYACVSLLKKYRGLNTGTDLARRAIDGLFEAERLNQITNERLLDVANFRTVSDLGMTISTRNRVLGYAQEIIRRVWGTPTLADLFDGCDWGPGATATLKGAAAHPENKTIEDPVQVTPTARPILQRYLSTDFQWLAAMKLKGDLVGPAILSGTLFSKETYGRVVTVPKSAKTDRVVMAEPTGNVFLQKGIGRYLRRRLYDVVHVDLDDQSRNQRLAQHAARRHLATLDLKDASNSITIGAVKLLCAPRMFTLLNRLRTPYYRLPKSKSDARFCLFSSMGNGFTFELESLIFYALTRACYHELQKEDHHATLGIYGDDIICRQDVVPLLVRVLTDFGFSINTEKSFSGGRFYESCGKHFFDSVDVTPVYQKDVVDSALAAARFYERMHELYNRFDADGIDTSVVRHRLLNRVIGTYPILVRVFNGTGVSIDGSISVPNTHHNWCPNRGYKVNYLAPEKKRRVMGDAGFYATQLRRLHYLDGQSQLASNGYMDLRSGGDAGVKVKRRWVSQAELYKYGVDHIAPYIYSRLELRWLRSLSISVDGLPD